MKISILCDSPNHPVRPRLERWAAESGHWVNVANDKSQLLGGDILFLISCGQIIGKADRDRYAKTLVIHAADLPKGRGWSPHIWQILDGAQSLTLTLLEAADKVDSGDIWHQVKVPIPPHFLHDEINEAIFAAELELMDWAVENFSTVEPQAQIGMASYYPKRTPADSELDISRSIAEQFNLLRVSDPERYPAFFTMHGQRYDVSIRKR